MKELWADIKRRDFNQLFVTPTTNIWIQLFRYGFVGGIAFVADAGVLWLLERIGLSYLTAAGFGFTVGLVVNFALSKCLVFRGNQQTHKEGTEFLVFFITGVIGLALTEGLMYVFTELLLLYFMISKVLAAGIVLIWNFLARKIILYSK